MSQDEVELDRYTRSLISQTYGGSCGKNPIGLGVSDNINLTGSYLKDIVHAMKHPEARKQSSDKLCEENALIAQGLLRNSQIYSCRY